MAGKKKKYVVGFDGDEQCIYGARHFGNTVNCHNERIDDYCDLMTEWQAKRAANVPLVGSTIIGKLRIYELVDVTPAPDGKD